MVSLGASLPFAIGREPAVPDQEGAVSESGNKTSTAAGKANDFVLNGMGIAPKHCVFKYTDEDDRDSLSVCVLLMCVLICVCVHVFALFEYACEWHYRTSLH